MLRHALRRLLWIVPILIGVTVTSFALLSYVPDPADDPAVTATLDPERAIELRRSRFLDLPRFFNERPLDVVGRVDQALVHLAADDSLAASARATLVRLGGAALPHLLSRLDGLDPAARARVAVALSPIAERMGIATDDTIDPSRAVAFWNRFWADRGIDFRAANARRAARRLSVHGTQTREADLLELDTFALEQMMAALDELSVASLAAGLPAAGGPLEAMQRLLAAAAHVTGRDDDVAEGAGEAEVRAAVRRWQEWWLVHRPDYTSYGGASRFVAMLTDTQYARWAERVVLLGFGTNAEGTPIMKKLRDRAPATMLLTASAIGFAYLLALALGVASAVRAQRKADAWLFAAGLAAFSTPTACLAVWTLRHVGSGALLAAALLGASMIASPLAQGRALVSEIVRSDYVRAARAFGMGPRAVAIHHAARATLLPLVALASVEMPTALGGAFVVEKIFGIAGLGDETVRAVQSHDVAWLVGLAFLTALVVTITSIATDFAVAAIDPRLSLAALRHRSMRS